MIIDNRKLRTVQPNIGNNIRTQFLNNKDAIQYLHDLEQEDIQDWDNYFNNNLSRGNSGNSMKNATGALAPAAFSMIDNSLTGGKSHKLGNTAVQLGGALATINPIWGGVVAALGTGINLAIGNNEAEVLATDNNIKQLNSFKVDDTNSDSIAYASTVAPVGMNIKRSTYGWANGDQYNLLKRKMDAAKGFITGQIRNANKNWETNTMKNAQLNYGAENQVALGGHLYGIGGAITGPTDYEMTNQYLINGAAMANRDNKLVSMPNSFACGGNKFLFGGVQLTAGLNFPTGLIHVDTGGTHEQNPNEGVLMGVDRMGTPNLVEEGEVVFGDYVFSNRLKVPVKLTNKKNKKLYAKGGKLYDTLTYEDQVLKLFEGMTYADAAKKMEGGTLNKDFNGKTMAPTNAYDALTLLAKLLVLQNSLEAVREEERLRQMQLMLALMSPEERDAIAQQMALQTLGQPTEEDVMQNPLFMQQQAPIGADYAYLQPSAEQTYQQEYGNEMTAPQFMGACGGRLHSLGGNLFAGGSYIDTPEEEETYTYSSKPANSAIQYNFRWNGKDYIVKADGNGSIIVTDNLGNVTDEAKKIKTNVIEDLYKRGSFQKYYGIEGVPSTSVADILNPKVLNINQDNFNRLLKNVNGSYNTAWLTDEVTKNNTSSSNTGEKSNNSNNNNVLAEKPKRTTKAEVDRAAFAVTRKYKNADKNFNFKKASPAVRNAYLEDVQRVIDNPDMLKPSNKDKYEPLNIDAFGASDNTDFESFVKQRYIDRQLKDLNGTLLNADENGRLVRPYYDREGNLVGNPGLQRFAKPETFERDEEGNLILNEDQGYYNYNKGGKDWNVFGYRDPKTGEFHKVEYNPSTEPSGNEVDKYKAWRQWFVDSGMNVDEYEGSDDYINDTIDFMDAVNSGNKDALKRLWTIGQATRSTNASSGDPLENRYFKKSADPNNLKLEDLKKDALGIPSMFNIGVPSENGIYGKDTQFYVSDNGNIIDEKQYNGLSDIAKRPYKKLEGKGITRQLIFDFHKQHRNDYPGDNGEVQFYPYLKSRYDQNPALTYLMGAPSGNTVEDYILVNENGTPILIDGDEIRVNPNNPLYSLYNNGEAIRTSNLDDKTTLYTKGIIGGNQDLHLTKIGDKVYSLTPDEIKKRGLQLSENQNQQDLQDLIPGYTGNVSWYDLNPDYQNAAEGYNNARDYLYDSNVVENGEYPKPPTWPIWTALGLQAALLGYNALTPIDESNANAIIDASKSAGKIYERSPKYIPDYVTEKKADKFFRGNRTITLGNTGNDYLANLSAGNLGNAQAGILANNMNTLNQLGVDDYQGELQNWQMGLQAAEFNKKTNEFNATAFNDMEKANLEAQSRASQAKLNGIIEANKLKELAALNKGNAIGAGITGLGNLLYNYWAQQYANKQTDWYQDKSGAWWSKPKDVDLDAERQRKRGGNLKRKRNKGLKF